VTGDITPEYLRAPESERSDFAKATRREAIGRPQGRARSDRGRSVSAAHTLLELFDAALRAVMARLVAAVRCADTAGSRECSPSARPPAPMALGARDALGANRADAGDHQGRHAIPTLRRAGAVQLEKRAPVPDERSLCRGQAERRSPPRCRRCIRFSWFGRQFEPGGGLPRGSHACALRVNERGWPRAGTSRAQCGRAGSRDSRAAGMRACSAVACDGAVHFRRAGGRSRRHRFRVVRAGRRSGQIRASWSPR
jgi:hypothetical protein